MAITRNDDLQDGKLVFEGTRITVGDIVESFYSLGQSKDQITSDLGVENSGRYLLLLPLNYRVQDFAKAWKESSFDIY